MNRLLAVTLTESEIAERGRMAAALEQAERTLEDERKTTNKRYQERIDGIRSRMRGIQAEIREGAKLVEVPVEWRRDFRRNVKELVRLDSGATIETEALTAEERQGELFVLEGGEGNGSEGEGVVEEARAEVG